MKTPSTSASFAAAAAIFAITAVGVSTPAMAKHHSMKVATAPCYGVNTCKGTSDCKTASNGCKGQNSCKGQGWKKLSSAACTSAGGSVTAPT